MTTTNPELRRCMGSAKYGIEPHEAPVDDFPKQPSQKDGLGRMCRTHWNQYTAALARDRKARLASEPRPAAAEAPPKPAKEPKPARKRAQEPKGESPTATERRRTFEKRLAKVGVGSEAGQQMIEQATKANGNGRRTKREEPSAEAVTSSE